MKVGISPCPNDIFVFSGLLQKKIDHTYSFEILELGDLNKLVFKEEYDFIKMSSTVLLQSKVYFPCNVGASFARKEGPKIVVRKDFSFQEKSFQSRLAVPSIEAVATKVALHFFPGFLPKEEPLHSIAEKVADSHYDFGVIVSEDMNHLDDFGLKTAYDLGEYWSKSYDFPLPLGVVGGKDPASFSEFETCVKSSVEWAKNNPNQALSLTREYSKNSLSTINKKHIALFTQDAAGTPKLKDYMKKLSSII